MTVDHTEFILAQQAAAGRGTRSSGPTVRQIMISFAFIVLYVTLCVALALMLDVDKSLMVAAGLLFVIAAGSAFLVQRTLFSLNAREKERMLIREVFEGSRGARLITDGGENTVYSNQRFDVLCEPMGKAGLNSLSRLFSDDEVAYAHFRTLAEQAQKGLTDSIELHTGEGDAERWFMVTAQPVAGWAGYVHWRVDDITRQREIDWAIREEREKLIDFTDNAPVGFYSADETGRFVFVNATLARWLGNDIEDLLRHERLHSYLDTPPKDAAPYDIIDKGGARQVAEMMMKGPGGRTFLASVNQTVVEDEDGRVRTRGVVHDLTSEREMRQALQASEDRFQRFFEEAPLGIALVDSDGVVQDCNIALASMMDLPLDHIEGKSFRDLIAMDSRDTAMDAIGRIGQGQQMAAPVELLLNGRKHVSVQMHGRRFKGGDNVVLHFIDLTEQKTLEAQFIQSQKMQAVGQLAGGVAHDFNNLLTAIIGFCDLLLLRHKPGDPSFGDIMQIKQNSNRAANLVRQLLAFSRQQTLRADVQDMTDILTEVSHLIRRLIGANIDLDVVHGNALGLVKVDVGQMEQVLINLAVNARDAMEEGGKLTITTSNFDNKKIMQRGDDDMPPGQWVMIEVTDSGSGIAPENLKHIFEPFFTTKDVGQGTGLGLATVYGIIRQTGGYLHVDSEVGIGTTFTIYLPRLSESEHKQAAARPKAEEETTGDLTGSARILLVEDEDAVRMFSTRALVNKGYDVLAAEHGEAALTLMEDAENANIDLLITDVMMPGIDGPTLATKMREKNPTLKIVFISGYTEDKLKDYMGEGIYFLPKPFTLKQLAAKIKDVIDD